MPVDVTFNDKSGIWELLSRPPTDVDELIFALRSVYQELDVNRPLLLLWQGVEEAGLMDAAGIQRLRNFMEAERPSVSGRTALVAESDVNFGMARVAHAYSDGVIPNMRPFRDRDEAIAWLLE
jgi:hypothetical protein